MPEDLSTLGRHELIELVNDLLRDREETARRLNRLTDGLQVLDARLLTVENSRIFRALQRVARAIGAWRAKGKRYVDPAHVQAAERRTYQLWLERKRLQDPADDWFRQECRKLAYSPRFSLLMHVNNPQRRRLGAALESVRTQSYTHWELCVCDDASPAAWVSQEFQKLAETDPRIQYVRSEQPMGPVSSLNRAGMLGAGEYVACLGQHDTLSPHALFYLADGLQRERFDLIYGDHDHLNLEGAREMPAFKPDWSPDLLVGAMYLGRFFTVARNRMDSTGWFRQETGTAYLYDLALRLAEQSHRFRRVPRLLASEAAGKDAREGDRESHRQALLSAIQRRGWQASLADVPDAGFTIRRKLSGTPLASIIICSRNPRLLRKCLRSIDSLTAYPVRETVVVQHKTGDDSAMERLLARSHCIRVAHAGEFDFAGMNNRGAQAASGEVLVFLNDDVEPRSADWLKELLAQAQRPEVGIVGAKLLYPSGATQHSGIALGLMDGAGHPQRGSLGAAFWPWGGVTRNVSAVTGACLAIRRVVFEELGGFDQRFPVNYNDVDLCLRARRAGYEVICETSAVLEHLESRTRVRGISWQERELFHERWGGAIEKGDPYYSPHLTRTKEDCSLGDV